MKPKFKLDTNKEIVELHKLLLEERLKRTKAENLLNKIKDIIRDILEEEVKG